MNILFLTLQKIDTLKTKSIYHDLMREFAKNGHQLCIVSPIERRENKRSQFITEENVKFLNVKILNIQKTNVLEKGFSTLSIEWFYLKAIKKYFKNTKFDLIIYSTPPITFTSVISYIKNRDQAKSYLLLKDIFPQNAVDMKLFSKDGFIYNFFRRKEEKLYLISDKIGCMSAANRNYLLKHNSSIDDSKVEINPNCVEIDPFFSELETDIVNLKNKYDLPLDKRIFVNGGNLGIPQGLDFLLETIENNKQNSSIYFLIVGSGTEFNKIQKWFDNFKPENAKLMADLPKMEYNQLIKACDIGLIFLHKDFTIPNFPSRLLSYLEYKLPVLVAADANTDIGTEVVKNKCGKSVLAGDHSEMRDAIQYFSTVSESEMENLGENGRNYLESSFDVQFSYQKIINSCAND